LNIISPPRPVLIYDGECSFCRLWIEHWHRLTGDHVDYQPSQTVAHQYPQISSHEFAQAVQFVLPDGTFYSGAEAVFRLLQHTSKRGWLLWVYQHVPGFALFSERAYGFIAINRNFFYWITIFLWGQHLGPYRYSLTRWLFLRALGLIYLIAFISLAGQIKGLIGSNGILPVQNFLQNVSQAYASPDRYLLVPTLTWLNGSDAFLQFLCIGGAVLAILLILDITTIPVLALLWVFYLSLVNAGQDFLSFQWDILLLEAGFLAIFLASFHLLPRLNHQRAPSTLIIWLYRWLLFRLMLMSGLAKLASNDITWRNLTALQFHYWTQPLPTPLAWHMAQMPLWFMQISTIFMFFVELFVPFLFFMPRRLRFIGAILTITLQILIILTGNYTFFNWLTIVLCIPLFDDDALRRFFPAAMRSIQQKNPSKLKRLIVFPLAIVIVFVGSIRLVNLVDARISPRILPLPLAQLYKQVNNWYLANGYGLFAVMTTTRLEIVIEGSQDGKTWLPYEFPYKAGDISRMPLYIAPYQPRLDWQMWFAALGDYRSNSWFVSFIYRLLQGSADVQALLMSNPFPDTPPTYIRAQLYQYQFTDSAEHGETGAWWKRELVGSYLPSVSLNDFTAKP
jgi:predicted DCC family thiol-disulfide oxidoreductase YuxK